MNFFSGLSLVSGAAPQRGTKALGISLYSRVRGIRTMDQDQDLLDRLERRERGGVTTVACLICGISVFAGMITYFTLQFEQNPSRELSLDTSVLIAIGACAALLFTYQKIR